MRWAPRTAAELVRVFELLEKLDGIVDAVDAEFERVDFPGRERDLGFAVRSKSAIAGEREIWSVFVLPQPGGRERDEQQHPKHRPAPHPSPRKIFHRYTPRNTG